MIHNPRITVATIVTVDGKYIIIEESIGQRLVLNQPSGHLEEDETFVEAARRETLEESGWSVDIDYLIGVYRLRVPEFNFIRFCFAASAREQMHEQPPDSSILAVHYLSRQQIEDTPTARLRSPLVSRCIEDFESGHRIELHRLQFLTSQ